MARPFSYPEVASMEVGTSCRVFAPASEVKRKVALYAARNNKRFSVNADRGADDGESVVVTRLPDPVADLPEVA